MVRVHYEGINSGDLDLAVTVFAPDVESVTPNGPMSGIEAFRALGEAFLAAAPDQKIEALRTWEQGDTIVVEGVYSGTQTGDLIGPGGAIPASGRPFTLPFADILTARDGKFVSHHIYWDNVALLAQLGALPAPAGA
jgi:ketosteroid isomerase-like protein